MGQTQSDACVSAYVGMELLVDILVLPCAVEVNTCSLWDFLHSCTYVCLHASMHYCSIHFFSFTDFCSMQTPAHHPCILRRFVVSGFPFLSKHVCVLLALALQLSRSKRHGVH